ncbi:iron ABC transporter permease [Brucella abortus]|uniref:ABC transporter permease n=1 Tax=Brucella abortus TaxID=235 RepID=UPI0001B49442|nr:iron ABC transporter permease [Brucella abortus]AIJ59401.1 binding--dependent transport system inner membrane component family protein [Brucella abortus]AIJ62498.1 binding--dependent transport system inner membrane component family protein [Brucella abortus bv. 9 str. C68]AIJ65233.1 binding--dependent transport system inner membrane component family protein [Brucella abortus bv. 6 str. 870]AIJ78469.1 binding--dependent transport system inner membrane component family protein [Brucella abortu
MTQHNRRLDAVLAIALIAFALLPWYRIEDGFLHFSWIEVLFSESAEVPGILQIFVFGRSWIGAIALLMLICAVARFFLPVGKRSGVLIAASLVGFIFLALQGLAIGFSGWNWTISETLFGPLSDGQPSFGAGAILTGLCFLLIFSFGLAERGVMKGDAFVVSSITLLVALVGVFVFYPVLSMFVGSVQDFDGSFNPDGFIGNIQDSSIWSLACVVGEGRCGVAWRTLWLALMTATGSTILGLAFALVATRTNFPFKKGLRLLTILPIITPPFVVGLALTLLFGRAGVVTEQISSLFGVEPGRWLYGLTGIWIAQVLSFTPISFLVLIGVVEGVSPSMEEASQTLRADRWRTFKRVSLPLMAPGLANAFLIAFIESMADFGNPMVLGGSHGVLSTEIFFAVVGAQNDPSRAAVLAIVLLCFTLSAFLVQRLWLSGKNFATVTGKGDSGIHAGLPRGLKIGVYALVIPWMFFTVVVYVMILVGGFVRQWGLDNSLTLEHYARAFSVSWTDGGLAWTGVAWNSFWTTMEISLMSAPLTAAVGLLTAYLIVRQRFVGRNVFEFALMLSFAIPGTVIGVSYIMAFNLPPLEMTGTALILIACFVFRNMPVGVRGGIAAMSQLDRSLDEASLTLRAGNFRTIRKVILTLLRPAITAALVYSFVRAITSISAVIFLVSAQYNMATAYIVGLVENGEFGVAIAYSSMLIVVMVVVITSFQLLVVERRLRRENRVAAAAPVKSVRQEKTA